MADTSRVAIEFVYQVTKYDPEHRDERGIYNGPAEERSDRGPVEAAYLEVVRSFARASAVERLDVRDPEVSWIVSFGLDAPTVGDGLRELFPLDRTGFHDGAQVSVDVGVELVRGMLRDYGAWCRLEVEDTFFVHVGYDQYMYIGSERECAESVQLARQLGLFPNRIRISPYAFDAGEAVEERVADESFWTALTVLAETSGRVLLEERWAQNASRWRRVAACDLEQVRAGLTPRAMLVVWPDLSPDLDGVIAVARTRELVELVWQSRSGALESQTVPDEHFDQLPALLSEATAASALSRMIETDTDDGPLLVGVLPELDGMLRARWPRVF